MREEYESILAEIFLKHLIAERRRLGLTQEAMAGLLFMSLRSYANLEHGINSCSSVTFAIFLINCSENPLEMLKEIKFAFSRAYAPV